MQAKQLYSFWQKWKDETQHYKVTMDTKVKIKLTRFVNNMQGAYFNRWKSNAFNKTNQIDNAVNQNQMRENEALQREAM